MAAEGYESFTFEALIGDGSLEIGDGYRAKNDELGGTGPIFLRAGHVTDTHIDFDGVERFHSELESRVRSKMARPGDAVVTTKGNSTGRAAFVTASMPPFVYSPHLSYWRSRDQTRIAPGFLRYWTKSREFLDQLAGMQASTDMAPYLSLVDQRRLRVSLPSIEQQRAIAHILGTLDDRIELNRRMNETLEAMARALFKSWFVDFDPVRAKMEGSRPPGMSDELTDLFPSKFIQEDVMLPQGWSKALWGDLAALEYGKGLRGYQDTSGRYPVYGTNGAIGRCDEFLCAGPGVIIGRKGAYRGVHYSEGPFFVIDTAFYLRPLKDIDTIWAYYEILRFDINSLDSGSAIPSTSREDFYRIPVIVPPKTIQAAFGNTVTKWFEKISHNKAQNLTLSSIRDSLLPKLLGGEVPVV